MPVPDLRAIARHYGGEVSGNQCLIPSPGHNRQDRGTAIRLAPGASDGVTVHCFNGEWREAKDMLRRDGFLPASGDARPRELSPAERETIRREEVAREKERAGAQAKAADKARRSVETASPADPRHPYLVEKRIPPERLWQRGDKLLVPLCDEAGKLWNCQCIAPDGTKRFLAGGRTGGLFWYAGQAGDRLIIGEGMATMAAVRRATGLPVIAAMSASNLPAVAKAIRARRPDLPLIIAADDDATGHEYACAAASVARADIVFPEKSNER